MGLGNIWKLTNLSPLLQGDCDVTLFMTRKEGTFLGQLRKREFAYGNDSGQTAGLLRNSSFTGGCAKLRFRLDLTSTLLEW